MSSRLSNQLFVTFPPDKQRLSPALRARQLPQVTDGDNVTWFCLYRLSLLRCCSYWKWRKTAAFSASKRLIESAIYWWQSCDVRSQHHDVYRYASFGSAALACWMKWHSGEVLWRRCCVQFENTTAERRSTFTAALRRISDPSGLNGRVDVYQLTLLKLYNGMKHLCVYSLFLLLRVVKQLIVQMSMATYNNNNNKHVNLLIEEVVLVASTLDALLLSLRHWCRL